MGLWMRPTKMGIRRAEIRYRNIMRVGHANLTLNIRASRANSDVDNEARVEAIHCQHKCGGRSHSAMDQVERSGGTRAASFSTNSSVRNE